MAITIDWATKVITVPKSDTQFVTGVPFEIRQLDIDVFRLALKELEASEEGIVFSTTHTHNQPVTVGGVTLARVLEIINGYTVTFENGAYGVNLVGANSNLADVVNLNNVQIRSANSAGLTFSDQINAQSFSRDAVSIDTVEGLSGIGFPRGTPTDPVDNFADAVIIASSRKLKSFIIRGSVVLSGGPYAAFNFLSSGVHAIESINLNGVDIGGCSVFGLNVTGVQGGLFTVYKNCEIKDATINGAVSESFLSGTIKLSSATDSVINHCNTGVGHLILDFDNVFSTANMSNFTGYITIRNMSNPSSTLELDSVSSKVIIENTCTDGTIILRGHTEVEDYSNGTEVRLPVSIESHVKISGKAQSGGANTITFPSYADSSNDFYMDGVIIIVSGTGHGQSGVMTSYNGSTKIATVSKNWITPPDSTSKFVVVSSGLAPDERSKLLSLLTLVNYLEAKD